MGNSALGFPLINSNIVTAVVASSSSNSISLSGSPSITLASGAPYYVEVTSGTYAGERFDVNNTATSGSTIGISTGSANNTDTLASIDLTGASIALRAHVTLSQIQGMFLNPLVGNNTQTSADQIS